MDLADKRNFDRFRVRLCLAITASLVFLLMLSCASTSAKSDVNQALAHRKLGESYYNVGQFQKAFVEFQKSLEFESNSKETHSYLGSVYLKFKDLPKALNHYSRAAALDPSYSEAHNNICFVQYTLKRYENAVTSCNKALANQTYKTPEVAFYNLGRAYHRMGQHQLSIDNYSHSLMRKPGLYPSYYGMALAFNALSNFGEAAASMREAITMDPKFKGDLDLAEMEFQRRVADPDEQADRDAYLEIINY